MTTAEKCKCGIDEDVWVWTDNPCETYEHKEVWEEEEKARELYERTGETKPPRDWEPDEWVPTVWDGHAQRYR